MSEIITSKWYQFQDTEDVNHYCEGVTEKEKNNKPTGTVTALTAWFNPAKLVEDKEDTYKCSACGIEASPKDVEFTAIGACDE